MSKLQLVTKAIITAIGLRAVTQAFKYADMLYPGRNSSMHFAVYVVFFALALAIFVMVLRCIVFNNDWLVKRISPDDQSPIPLTDQKLLLARSMRIAFVLLGLLLLRSSLYNLIFVMRFLWPPDLLVKINGLLNGVFPSMSDVCKWSFNNSFKAILFFVNVCLLLGFTPLVNWHIKRLAYTQPNTDMGDDNNE